MTKETFANDLAALVAKTVNEGVMKSQMTFTDVTGILDAIKMEVYKMSDQVKAQMIAKAMAQQIVPANGVKLPNLRG